MTAFNRSGATIWTCPLQLNKCQASSRMPEARNRTIASEYAAKFFTVADAIRYNRSDTSLVRVVVGVDGRGTDYAIQTAVDFVKGFFEPLKHYLPA